MTGFASKLINARFKRAPARPATARRAALGFEPLDIRAVLSTVLPTTVADDVVVDGQVITGQNWESARSGGGQGAGKAAMQDGHFVRSASATSRHTGGVNVLFADGSVRFISDSIGVTTIKARSGGSAGGTHTGGGGGGTGKVAMQDFHFSHPTGALRNHAGGVQVALGDGSVRFVSDSIVGPAWNTARGAGGGGGTGKVSMQDFGFISLSVAGEPADKLVLVGTGAQPHVKVFDGARSGEISSFLAFPGFNGGVSVGAADVNDSADDDNGHGTHVAGTIGASTSGVDHPDLYKNIWINQSLESVIDILANDR